MSNLACLYVRWWFKWLLVNFKMQISSVHSIIEISLYSVHWYSQYISSIMPFPVPNYLSFRFRAHMPPSTTCFRPSPQELYYLSFLWLVIVLSHDLLLSQVSRLVTWCTVKRGPLTSLAGAQRERQSTPSCGNHSFDHSLTDSGTTDIAVSIDFYFAMLYLMLRLRNMG